MKTVSFVVFTLTMGGVAEACSDILVTPGATIDGSAMIAYNADAPELFGTVYHYPASQGNEGRMRQIYNWDTGKYLGAIPEAEETFNVVGNSNEHGLVIAESTFGGVEELCHQKGAVMDYGSLIWVTLQRSRTADEAIATMAELMDTYGYASEGESFSIADRSGAVWIMEVIGTGNSYGRLGAVWVAQRIPDGHVSAHANQARITTFARDDPDNVRFADDVLDVALHYGLYPHEADPLDFSFSDVYDPLEFVGVRLGEARVWSIFSPIADTDGTFQEKHKEYALGNVLTQRMPLSVQPYKKLSVLDVMQLFNSHFEGTDLDQTVDVGAGIFGSPYRPRPLVWDYHGTSYHNERSVGTPKSGWSFVAQIRPWMPAELSAFVWFGADDSSTTPRVPVFGSNTAVAEPYAGKGSQDGVQAPIMRFDLSKAFWVQNMVSNFCYFRWQDAYPVVRAKIDQLQQDLLEQVAALDRKALQIYDSKGSTEAVRFVTEYSVQTAEAVHKEWMDFYGELFVRFRDFYDIVPKEGEPVCGCKAKEPGLSDVVKKRIIDETGDHYEVAPGASHLAFNRAMVA